MPHNLRRIQRIAGTDLEDINGDTSWTLPMPARYVIARGGTIAYSEINPDYTCRSEPAHLFPVLDASQRRVEA